MLRASRPITAIDMMAISSSLMARIRRDFSYFSAICPAVAENRKNGPKRRARSSPNWLLPGGEFRVCRFASIAFTMAARIGWIRPLRSDILPRKEEICTHIASSPF